MSSKRAITYLLRLKPWPVALSSTTLLLCDCDPPATVCSQDDGQTCAARDASSESVDGGPSDVDANADAIADVAPALGPSFDASRALDAAIEATPEAAAHNANDREAAAAHHANDREAAAAHNANDREAAAALVSLQSSLFACTLITADGGQGGAGGAGQPGQAGGLGAQVACGGGAGGKGAGGSGGANGSGGVPVAIAYQRTVPVYDADTSITVGAPGTERGAPGRHATTGGQLGPAGTPGSYGRGGLAAPVPGL